MKKQQKSAWEIVKQGSNTYDFRALWRRIHDLGMISSTNNQERLERPPKSQSNNRISSPLSLSGIPQAGPILLSQQKTPKNQLTQALNDLNKL